MGWRAIAFGRSQGGEDEMDEMLEKAYKEGREHGYEQAMDEMHGRGGYGERGGYSGGTGGRSGSGGGYSGGSYGNRYDEEDDDMDFGERRGVKGTGRYSRSRRRY